MLTVCQDFGERRCPVANAERRGVQLRVAQTSREVLSRSPCRRRRERRAQRRGVCVARHLETHRPLQSYVCLSALIERNDSFIISPQDPMLLAPQPNAEEEKAQRADKFYK